MLVKSAMLRADRRVAGTLMRVVLAAGVISCLVGAASPAGAQATERDLFVSVLDQAGAPVTGLEPDAFVVREDGRAVEVLRVSRATEPIDLALLVDNSQAAEPYIRDLRSALQSFVDRMTKGGHHVAIVGLGDRPTILVDYTSSASQAAQGIGRIFSQPGSGTTLLDAINDTSRGLQKRDSERRAILVITTEGTDFSTPNHQRALDSIKASGASFNTLVITRGGGGAINTDEARSRAIVLDQGPRVSGGRYTQLLSSMALKDELDKVAADLENQYHLVYARPGSLIPPEKIEVSVKQPGLTARGTPAPVRKAASAGER
jgi:VWFA-related protein